MVVRWLYSVKQLDSGGRCYICRVVVRWLYSVKQSDSGGFAYDVFCKYGNRRTVTEEFNPQKIFMSVNVFLCKHD